MRERLFRAPGRAEIAGNHTDHQRGCVLAAAIGLETKCTASPNGTNVVHLSSEGFCVTDVDLSDLAPRECEKGKTAALVRGIAAWFRNRGYDVGGFDGSVSSEVPVGIGLSSSASFEVLIGNVLKGLFDLDVSSTDIALAGQFAENEYFGKPCGLMDQIASATGGLLLIDFQNPHSPAITPISAGFYGYALCVVAAGGSHADLTADYAAIPTEMKAVARCFGKDDLCSVDPGEFFASIAEIRNNTGDRALLRAMHFFEENERVRQLAAVAELGDTPEFLRLVNESGNSSRIYLQNIYNTATPTRQPLALTLALCERILNGEGAFRVHGGGFEGSVLAFVPSRLRESFEQQMSDVFGRGCCHFLAINPMGGREAHE